MNFMYSSSSSFCLLLQSRTCEVPGVCASPRVLRWGRAGVSSGVSSPEADARPWSVCVSLDKCKCHDQK